MAKEFTIATRAVLVGMAIALGAALLVALDHAGHTRRQAAGREADEADEAAEAAEPATESRR